MRFGLNLCKFDMTMYKNFYNYNIFFKFKMAAPLGRSKMAAV